MDRPGDHVPLRSARNRIIDALEIGDCYPLTDLNVVADRLKVPFGGTVPIPIAHAQSRVRYELCNPKGQPLGSTFGGEGRDATLVFESPRVLEDVTYRIRATKAARGGGAPLVRFLEETAPVKVGLDSTLPIEVGDVWARGSATPAVASILDPSNPRPGLEDPRLVPHAAAVDVRVSRSQEGVEYSLVVDGRDVPGDTRMGDLGTVVLRTPALREDTVIQVRATKRFLSSDNRPPETGLLDSRLFVKVRPDPGVSVAVAGGPVAAYGAGASVTVAASQRSASYRVFVRAIPDRDFVFGGAGGVAVTAVTVAAGGVVQVREPDRGDVWVVPDGYQAIGDADIQGTDADLAIALPGLTEDSMAIVRATKAHRLGSTPGDDRLVSSSVRLDAAAVILVRPDPLRPLSLWVPVAGDRIVGDVQVRNGQPGVMYELLDPRTGAPAGRPAYFHKRDDRDATQNEGVGQLVVGVDFIVPAESSSQAALPDRPRQIPPPPEVTLAADGADRSWRLRATRARTGLAVELSGDVTVGAAPAIRAESAVVDAGTSTNIVIEGGRTGERYQLAVDGRILASPVASGPAAVTLPTGAVAADTVFTVEISRPGDTGSTVVKQVAVAVSIRRPDPDLT